MATNRRKLFEDLGLMADGPEPTNPLSDLGVDQDFARELLKEDTNGQALKIMANGFYKVLSRRYHPDNQVTGNSERFRLIDEANQRIEGATAARLLMWSKAQRNGGSSASLAKAKADYETAAEKAGLLVQSSLQHARHPLHFSEIARGQGLLAKRNNNTFLIRSTASQGIEVRHGYADSASAGVHKDGKESQAFDFQSFLKTNDSFGIQPGTPIAAYVNNTGRAYLLNNDYSFNMDVSDPVNAYRAKRKTFNRREIKEVGSDDAWARSTDPILYVTATPESSTKPPSSKMYVFPEMTNITGTGRRTVWDLPFDVVGSLSDEQFFNRSRNNRSLGAMALLGTQDSRVMNSFNMMATSTRKLFEGDSGYSPLITPGNSILLYDQELNVPIVTDAHVIGLLGSGAHLA